MWKFETSATHQSNYLNKHSKEVCFVGRSNVGKSSLINALAGSKIAKTSGTPGKTRTINFFSEKKHFFVDLPGYGYARMSKKDQNKMLTMIENYLQFRDKLVKIFILIDAKVGLTSDDQVLINFLLGCKKIFFIVLTKSDKTNQSQLYKTEKTIKIITKNYLVVSAFKSSIKFNKLKKRTIHNFS